MIIGDLSQGLLLIQRSNWHRRLSDDSPVAMSLFITIEGLELRSAFLLVVATAFMLLGAPQSFGGTDAVESLPSDIRMGADSSVGLSSKNVQLAQVRIAKATSKANKGSEPIFETTEKSTPSDLPIQLENIKPLYTSPGMPGEGVWDSSNSPRAANGNPIIHKTFYRPSVDFPNAIVYMMVIDMSKAFMQYYVGSQEPAAGMATSEVEPDMRARIMAVTNAMWMQRHSKGAGAIFRGKVMYPMVDGMATLIVYKDGSPDIQEWGPDIPVHLVRDARQLRHLIVKNGMVVQSVYRNGHMEDSEIGLGFLLGGGGRNFDGKHFWFVAHRSAFGIRKDGNLVFAIGHHIGSKDLAKALVLAGCERGMHADANPHNIVANIYVRDVNGALVAKQRLSPEQSEYTLKRYDDGYSKDFFAFFPRDHSGAGNKTVSRIENGN